MARAPAWRQPPNRNAPNVCLCGGDGCCCGSLSALVGVTTPRPFVQRLAMRGAPARDPQLSVPAASGLVNGSLGSRQIDHGFVFLPLRSGFGGDDPGGGSISSSSVDKQRRR